ncbi:hypothetical protein V3N99_19585 [Dermatophilaceae bacterium Soc4.6]
MAAWMHTDYQSEQPYHPARGGGRAQMKANWGAILTGVSDLGAEVQDIDRQRARYQPVTT